MKHEIYNEIQKKQEKRRKEVKKKTEKKKKEQEGTYGGHNVNT